MAVVLVKKGNNWEILASDPKTLPGQTTGLKYRTVAFWVRINDRVEKCTCHLLEEDVDNIFRSQYNVIAMMIRGFTAFQNAWERSVGRPRVDGFVGEWSGRKFQLLWHGIQKQSQDQYLQLLGADSVTPTGLNMGNCRTLLLIHGYGNSYRDIKALLPLEALKKKRQAVLEDCLTLCVRDALALRAGAATHDTWKFHHAMTPAMQQAVILTNWQTVLEPEL